MAYDVEQMRSDVPALRSGVAFFDGPGGTQTPTQVISAISAALCDPLSDRPFVTPGENAERIVAESRHALADFVGGVPDGIVFGRSATQLTYDFSRALAAAWGPDDEVVVTRLDHDANVRPWVQAAERVGATVRWVDFDPASTELIAADVAPVLSERTRLVAVTAGSNLIGTRPPVAEIAALVHEAGALLYVDAVHYAAHVLIDLDELGADFVVCSPYKFLGPHLGVLASRPATLESLRPDKLLPQTDDVPERFEYGTLPYELLAGTTAAVDYLADIAPGEGSGDRRTRLARSMAEIEKHEDDLRSHAEDGLGDLDGIIVWSRAAHRTPTLLMTFERHDAADAYHYLASFDIAAPAGSFCAIEPSRRLGLGDAGGLRIGMAPYNNVDDVHRVLSALSDFIATR
jgi:cysteine desulfurase family protein (TIGR01976 family)